MHRKQGLFQSVVVDDIEMAGRRQNLNPMWKTLMNLVELGEPTSCLDHVHVSVNRTKVSHESLLEQLKSYLDRKNRTRKESLGLMTWTVMRRKVWKDVANWRIQRLSNCIRYLLHASTTITSRRKKEK